MSYCTLCGEEIIDDEETYWDSQSRPFHFDCFEFGGEESDDD